MPIIVQDELQPIADMIERPIVKLVYAESGTVKPEHCIFEIEVNFKPINGVVPYPKLVYQSERKSINTATSQGQILINTMLRKVEKHKDLHDFLRSKQSIVDSSLSEVWSV